MTTLQLPWIELTQQLQATKSLSIETCNSYWNGEHRVMIRFRLSRQNDDAVLRHIDEDDEDNSDYFGFDICDGMLLLRRQDPIPFQDHPAETLKFLWQVRACFGRAIHLQVNLADCEMGQLLRDPSTAKIIHMILKNNADSTSKTTTFLKKMRSLTIALPCGTTTCIDSIRTILDFFLNASPCLENLIVKNLQDMQLLTAVLVAVPRLKKLIFDQCLLFAKNDDAAALTQLHKTLQKHQHQLQTLGLSYCRLRSFTPTLRKLILYVVQSCVETLDLQGNPLGQSRADGQFWESILASTDESNLRELILDSSTPAISHAMLKNTFLKRLHMMSPRTMGDILELSSMILLNTTLTHLSVGKFEKEDQLARFCQRLQRNTSLESIKIWTHIEGIQSAASIQKLLLSTHASTVSLNLDFYEDDFFPLEGEEDELDADVVRLLVEGIQQTNVPHILIRSSRLLRDESFVSQLAEAVESNKSIQSLQFDDRKRPYMPPTDRAYCYCSNSNRVLADYEHRLRFYPGRNQCVQQVLSNNDDAAPASLWPNILSRIDNESVLYFLIQSQPGVVNWGRQQEV